MRFHHDANPSWHHLDWSPHWCPDSTSPSQDSSRLQDSVSEGPPLTRGGHRAKWQQVLDWPRSAKPIQVQLQPQGEFDREELALLEGYFKRRKASRSMKSLLHLFRACT